MDKSIFETMRDGELAMQQDVQISEHVTHNLYDTLATEDAYLNSVHTSGLTDSLGREKPFFNISVAAANIWWRATDVDTSRIMLLPPSLKKTIQTYAAYALLQNWIRRNNFGLFLNQWGLTLARHGSAVVKFIEVDKKLIASVVPWNRLIVDPIDFYALPRIEKFYKTPAQLKAMATKGHPDYAGYDVKAVQNLIENVTTRKTGRGNQKDNVSKFIELYEVHGELSEEMYKNGKGIDVYEGDESNFFQQMHVVSFVKSDSGFDDYTLFVGKEKQDPYMITHLIEEDGRTKGKGAVEYMFDNQWMVNHTMKNMKDYLDLASMIIFQTADQGFQGRNVITAMQTGDIFQTQSPISRVDNSVQNIGALTSYLNQWRVGGQDVSATPDALRGSTQPSGTSGLQVQSLQEQALSLFDMMVENKKMYLNTMLRKFILPNLKKNMDTVEEVTAILADDDIKKLDASFVPQEARKQFDKAAADALFNMQVPPQFDPATAQANVQQSLIAQGNKRTFKPSDMEKKTWSESLKDFEWEVVIEDGESADKRQLFGALQTFLQVVKNNALTAPELAQAQQQQGQVQVQPQGQGQQPAENRTPLLAKNKQKVNG